MDTYITQIRRKLKSSLIAAFATSLLLACGQKSEERSGTPHIEEQKDKKARAGLNQQKVPEELLSLAGYTQNREMGIGKESPPEENLYGKFFDERAEFYIIEQPQNSLYRSKVKKLTLYYLDGKLSQTRYILEENIGDDLLRMYGSFGITGNDAKNQALIRAKQIIVHTQEGPSFNKDLDNYQVSWQLEEQQIRYRVNKHDPKAPFNYLERVKVYKKAFSEIERGGQPDLKM